jgi:hypothetical protein
MTSARGATGGSNRNAYAVLAPPVGRRKTAVSQGFAPVRAVPVRRITVCVVTYSSAENRTETRIAGSRVRGFAGSRVRGVAGSRGRGVAGRARDT